VDSRIVKAFRRVKRKRRRGANARRRTITIAEYLKLVEVAAPHLKEILTVGYNTGMRTAEIIGLRWSHIGREKWVIRLPAELPKGKKAKAIPINHRVKARYTEWLDSQLDLPSVDYNVGKKHKKRAANFS
jgi:integrase